MGGNISYPIISGKKFYVQNILKKILQPGMVVHIYNSSTGRRREEDHEFEVS
jgi:hypothetical protein